MVMLTGCRRRASWRWLEGRLVALKARLHSRHGLSCGGSGLLLDLDMDIDGSFMLATYLV